MKIELFIMLKMYLRSSEIQYFSWKIYKKKLSVVISHLFRIFYFKFKPKFNYQWKAKYFCSDFSVLKYLRVGRLKGSDDELENISMNNTNSYSDVLIRHKRITSSIVNG